LNSPGTEPGKQDPNRWNGSGSIAKPLRCRRLASEAWPPALSYLMGIISVGCTYVGRSKGRLVVEKRIDTVVFVLATPMVMPVCYFIVPLGSTANVL
jgi:hypothetical protein